MKSILNIHAQGFNIRIIPISFFFFMQQMEIILYDFQ